LHLFLNLSLVDDERVLLLHRGGRGWLNLGNWLRGWGHRDGGRELRGFRVLAYQENLKGWDYPLEAMTNGFRFGDTLGQGPQVKAHPFGFGHLDP
jgi:hypothetical protein